MSLRIAGAVIFSVISPKFTEIVSCSKQMNKFLQSPKVRKQLTQELIRIKPSKCATYYADVLIHQNGDNASNVKFEALVTKEIA